MTAPEQTNHLAGALVAIARDRRSFAQAHLAVVLVAVVLIATALSAALLPGRIDITVAVVPFAIGLTALNLYAEETRLAVAYEGVAALVRRHPELTVSVIDYVTRGDMSAAVLRLHNLSRRRLRA